MAGAIKQGADVGLAAPRHIDDEHAAFCLVPHDAFEGNTRAGFARAQTIRLGDGTHTCSHTNIICVLQNGNFNKINYNIYFIEWTRDKSRLLVAYYIGICWRVDGVKLSIHVIQNVTNMFALVYHLI